MSSSIMIADDAPFIREILKKLVEDKGFVVVAEAENGKIAVEVYREHSPDIVLMDMSMPIKSGIDATKEIVEYDSQAKVIGISTIDRDIMMLKAMDAGCVDYVAKPFQGPEVIEALYRAVGGRK